MSPVSRNKKARPPGYAFPRIHSQNIILYILSQQVIVYLATRSRALDPALSETEGVSAHFLTLTWADTD